MDKRYDVIALGELLIDFTDEGDSPAGAPLFAANPGGAPGNVLALLSRLGRKTAFIGKVGDDFFGDFLRRTLKSAGIDDGGLMTEPKAGTALAFVKNAPNGEREFSFYRDPGADELLTENDLPEDLLKSCRIFHFGTLSMTRPEGKAATLLAAKTAKENGALISFDPNLRFSLWKNETDLKSAAFAGFALADIVKLADDELRFLTGEADPGTGARTLRARFPGIKLLNVTFGAEGCRCYYNDLSLAVPAFSVDAVDTTGAGDAFAAAVLHDLLRNGLRDRSEDDLREMLRFANAAAAIVTTRKGAFQSMPEKAQIRRLLSAAK